VAEICHEQGRSPDLRVRGQTFRGSGGRKSPAGSRGRAPAGVWGQSAQKPQNLKTKVNSSRVCIISENFPPTTGGMHLCPPWLRPWPRKSNLAAKFYFRFQFRHVSSYGNHSHIVAMVCCEAVLLRRGIFVYSPSRPVDLSCDVFMFSCV